MESAALAVKFAKVLECGDIRKVSAPSVGLLVGAGTPVYQFFPNAGIGFGLAQQTDNIEAFIETVYYMLLDENIINLK